MNSKQPYCLGGRHFSQTVNENVYEKVNPETKKLLKIIIVTCSFAVVINHKFLLSKRLKDKILLKGANVKIIMVRLCQNQHELI